MAEVKHNVMLGLGDPSGMAYYAPADTALPAIGEEPSGEWQELGWVAEDGITLSTNRDMEKLRNWALETVRLMPGDEDGTLEVPFMDTEEHVLKILFSESAVTVTAASAQHGKQISVNIDPTLVPEGFAFCFVMKDGNKRAMLGTTRGFVTSVGDVAFAPQEAVNWSATISAKTWTYVTDDGEVTE